MSKKQTNRSRFQSLYGKTFCDASHYLAELILERQAKQRKSTLPQSFWLEDKYKFDYSQQKRYAEILLKLYSPETILRVLRKNPTIWSLRANWLDQKLKDEQVIVDKEHETMQNAEEKKELIEIENVVQPQVCFGNVKSKSAKLRDLDA